MSYREVSEIRDGMRIDWDTPIKMDDGLVLRCDVYRPIEQGKYPVILNLPLIGLWVRLLRVPYRLLFPAIIVFCCVGAYTINSKPFDLAVMAFFAIFGYVALKLDCEPAPLILGFVLGPMMEENLRRALLISRGDPMVFLQEPISLAFLLVAVGLLVVIAAPAIRKKREEALQE